MRLGVAERKSSGASMSSSVPSFTTYPPPPPTSSVSLSSLMLSRSASIFAVPSPSVAPFLIVTLPAWTSRQSEAVVVPSRIEMGITMSSSAGMCARSLMSTLRVCSPAPSRKPSCTVGVATKAWAPP